MVQQEGFDHLYTASDSDQVLEVLSSLLQETSVPELTAGQEVEDAPEDAPPSVVIGHGSPDSPACTGRAVIHSDAVSVDDMAHLLSEALSLS